MQHFWIVLCNSSNESSKMCSFFYFYINLWIKLIYIYAFYSYKVFLSKVPNFERWFWTSKWNVLNCFIFHLFCFSLFFFFQEIWYNFKWSKMCRMFILLRWKQIIFNFTISKLCSFKILYCENILKTVPTSQNYRRK